MCSTCSCYSGSARDLNFWTFDSSMLHLSDLPTLSDGLASWPPSVLGHIQLLIHWSSSPGSQITGLIQTLTSVWLSPDPLPAHPEPAVSHTTASQTPSRGGVDIFFYWNHLNHPEHLPIRQLLCCWLSEHSMIKQHSIFTNREDSRASSNLAMSAEITSNTIYSICLI